MESEVGWGMAILFMVLAAAHALEELVAGRTSSRVYGFGIDARLDALAGERISRLPLLLALAASGALVGACWIWLALGIVTADLVQHAALGIRARTYIPGAATGALLALYVLFFLGSSLSQPSWDQFSSWGAMLIGIAFASVCNLSARRRRPLAPHRAVGGP
jgi:hypothetical protein